MSKSSRAMFGLVARMLLLSSAAGTVFWTVNDEVQKKVADTKALQEVASELGEINNSVSVADERLKQNQSILLIIQDELGDAKNASGLSLHQLKEQNETVQKKIKETDIVKAKLQKSAAKSQEASADEIHTKDTLEASEKAIPAKETAVQKANDAYANAKAHLEAVITGDNVNDILAAHADVEDKKNTLEAAQAELKAAKKSKAENSKTVSEKAALVQKRRVEQQDEQKAFDDASAALGHARGAEENYRRIPSRPSQGPGSVEVVGGPEA